MVSGIIYVVFLVLKYVFYVMKGLNVPAISNAVKWKYLLKIDY